MKVEINIKQKHLAKLKKAYKEIIWEQSSCIKQMMLTDEEVGHSGESYFMRQEAGKELKELQTFANGFTLGLSILGVCVRDNKFYNGKGEKL